MTGPGPDPEPDAVRTWVVAHPGATRAQAAAALGTTPAAVVAALGRDAGRLLTDVRARGRDFTDEEVSAALRRAAAVAGEPLSVAAYDAAEHGGPSSARVVQRAGSWNAACARAGLAVRAGRARAAGAWTPETVLGAVADYLASPGARGSYADYQAWARRTDGAPSGQTLRNHAGTWAQAKTAALARTTELED